MYVRGEKTKTIVVTKPQERINRNLEKKSCSQEISNMYTSPGIANLIQSRTIMCVTHEGNYKYIQEF